MKISLPKQYILGTPVTCLTFDEQIMLMVKWAKMRESRSVCLANVHMLMEAYWNHQFARVLNKADLVTPDGMPLVWMLRKLGIYHQNRVAGLDVFVNLCELAQQSQISVYFVGSEPEVLQEIKRRIDKDYPILRIAGMEALPYLSLEETAIDLNEQLIEKINQSGAGLVFVCLGCPKQEIWMSRYRGKIDAVMVGVGAVFSMYAGINPRAPIYLQKAGLEWLYRLAKEPRRLWNRYSSTIPPFMYLAFRQLLRPYKEKFKAARQNLSDKNLVIDLENLDNTPNKMGEILVRQGLLTREELTSALSEQQQFPNLKLGEILVRRDYISLPQLKYYLKNQNIRLGDVLLEKKLIKPQKLNKIIYLQQKIDKKLGEILVERKLISEQQLQASLLEQYYRRKGLWLSYENSDYKKMDKIDEYVSAR